MAAVAVGTLGAAEPIARRRTFRNRWYRTPSFVAGATIVLALILASRSRALITPLRPERPGPAAHATPTRAARTGSAPTSSGATSSRASSTPAASTS